MSSIFWNYNLIFFFCETVRKVTKDKKIFASSSKLSKLDVYDKLPHTFIQVPYKNTEETKRLRNKTTTVLILNPDDVLSRAFSLKFQSKTLTIPEHTKIKGEFHTKRCFDGGQGHTCEILQPLFDKKPQSKYNAYPSWFVSNADETYSLFKQISMTNDLNSLWDSITKSSAIMRFASMHGDVYSAINFHFNKQGLQFMS